MVFQENDCEIRPICSVVDRLSAFRFAASCFPPIVLRRNVIYLLEHILDRLPYRPSNKKPGCARLVVTGPELDTARALVTGFAEAQAAA
jgi:hypothetical protein